MATVSFPENFYTLRTMDPIFGTIFNPRAPDQAALAQIESVLTQATIMHPSTYGSEK